MDLLTLQLKKNTYLYQEKKAENIQNSEPTKSLFYLRMYENMNKLNYAKQQNNKNEVQFFCMVKTDSKCKLCISM